MTDYARLVFHAVDDGGTGTVPDGQRYVGEIFEVILRKWKQKCFHFCYFLVRCWFSEENIEIL